MHINILLLRNGLRLHPCIKECLCRIVWTVSCYFGTSALNVSKHLCSRIWFFSAGVLLKNRVLIHAFRPSVAYVTWVGAGKTDRETGTETGTQTVIHLTVGHAQRQTDRQQELIGSDQAGVLFPNTATPHYAPHNKNMKKSAKCHKSRFD